ncbi:toxin glutamine deamidase domain-containing protein [Amycolatopsis sp. NPDC005232]|uniref:toxin glutamine deamidase domain-containing protein n=1 Tax=Amycolatopsis sp. NPDC005232 TaxID=3157027 RepID=UPI0033B71BA5
MHGLGDTTSSFFNKVGGAFVPGNKVKASAGPGGTTRPSINADTLGAGNFASKYYPNLNKLNPTKNGQNCTLAITSVDDMLGGKIKPAATLPPGGEIGTSVGANHPLRQKNPNADRPEDLDNWDQVIDRASQHPNSKGYVVVTRDDMSSHVMNVVNTDKGVVFLDGQSGKLGRLDADPRNVQYFRYDPPTHGAQGPPPGWTPPAAPAPHPVPPAAAPAGTGIDPVYQDWLKADQHFNG